MTPITTSMLEFVVTNTNKFAGSSNAFTGYTSKLSTFRVKSENAETPEEIAKLNQALSVLSSDVGYGTGSFYNHNEEPKPDYWLAGIWAIASLDWTCGKDIARSWSQQSPRYSDVGFENAWNSYDPSHPNRIGIGSLYRRANEMLVVSLQPPVQNTQGYSKRFNLLSASELTALPATEWVVKGILPKSGLAAIYGASGSGKTFLALDLMMAIACGTGWFGHRVKNKPVVYIGLEGKGGLSNRVKAWEKENSTSAPTNFKVIVDNFNLKTEMEVRALADDIVAAQMQHGVIVIDTLNQATPGSDENSSVDMSLNINHLKLLQELTEGLVIIIHHTGKDLRQGLRGHSSLKGALDANIEVSGTDKRSWLLEKSKDGQDGINRGFKLKVVELGKDSDGESITSCVIERDHSAIFVKAEPSGTAQKSALKALKAKLNVISKITVEDAVDAIKPTLATTKSNQRTNRARKLVQDLINNGYLLSSIENDEGVIWLP